MISKELFVVAVHGEGDRAKVNADKAALNKLVRKEHARVGIDPPAGTDAEPDEPPDVLAVLRDADHHNRIELHLLTWEDVEAFKAIAGFDAEKRHWKTGAKITLSLA